MRQRLLLRFARAAPVDAAGTGLVLGTTAALLASRVLESLLFGTTPIDPITVAVSVTVLAATAVAAAYLPARRAGRLNPAVALRND